MYPLPGARNGDLTLISVAVPTYNERQNIAELVKQTGEALLACGEDYELIIVDDSSPDGTAEEVGRLQEKRPWRCELATRGATGV